MSKNIVLILLSVALGGALVWIFVGSSGMPEAPRNTSGDSVETTSHEPVVDTAESPKRPKRPSGPNPSHRSERPDHRSAELEQFVDDLRGKIIVDLGTVEEIGKQTAAMLISKNELSHLKSIAPADRTPSENQRLLELERQSAAALGILPEIANFQNDPDQYGRFFAALIEGAAGLDQSQTVAVFNYMKGRGESMVAAGLNAANEPADPLLEGPWEERRDAFNARTTDGVADILPPGEAERIGFTPGFLELLEQDFDKAD